nr:GNAT family N-acetyltransferase [uncultured Allomuricauda sp.]
MIRPYQDIDLESVMTIWYNAQEVGHPFLSQKFIEKVKKMMKDKLLPNSKTWVYTNNNQVYGFVSMIGNEIGGLFVDPNMQSKGIGSHLLTHMLRFNEVLEVEVFDQNSIGKSFYQKHGFKILTTYIHKETNEKVLRMEFK